MQRVGLLNGTNISYDKDFSAGNLSLMSSHIIEGFGISGTGVSAEILPGKALIECIRTNGEKIMIHFESTANVPVDMTGTKKVYINVSQAKLDDGSANASDGTGIASITTGASYPASNFIALYSIVTDVITDEKVGLNVNGFKANGIINQAISGNIASATTTDLSTATGNTTKITGTTTITSFGIAPAGTKISLEFADVLILTHNATSLILPGLANITTTSGDTAEVVSLGSGNWKCLSYQKVNGQAIDNSTNITSLIEDIAGDMDLDYIVKNNGTGANKKIKVNKYRATDAEALAGTVENKFINPKQNALTVLASDAVIAESASNVYTTNTTYTKIKEVVCNKAGTYRVKWTITTDTNGSNHGNVTGATYKNGTIIGAPLTIDGYIVSGNQSENFTFAEGDLIQLYIKNNVPTNNAYGHNFQVCGNVFPTSVIPTINL